MKIMWTVTSYVGLSLDVLLLQHNKVKAVDTIQDDEIERNLANKKLDLIATYYKL